MENHQPNLNPLDENKTTENATTNLIEVADKPKTRSTPE
jgi:hypothetical protein